MAAVHISMYAFDSQLKVVLPIFFIYIWQCCVVFYALLHGISNDNFVLALCNKGRLKD